MELADGESKKYLLREKVNEALFSKKDEPDEVKQEKEPDSLQGAYMLFAIFVVYFITFILMALPIGK